MALSEPQQPNRALAITGGDPIVDLVFNYSIRRKEVDGKVYYSLVDFVGRFSDTEDNPAKYWFNVKRSMVKEGFDLSSEIRKFKFRAQDGKMRPTDCGDIVTIRRVIMSIPSEKAEPLRMWMAGRQEFAYLRYDHRNVIEGRSWAADTVHEEIADLELPEPESPYADMGYIDRKADKFAPPDSNSDRWNRQER